MNSTERIIERNTSNGNDKNNSGKSVSGAVINLSKNDFEILSAIEIWGLLCLGQIMGLRLRGKVSDSERTRLLFNEILRSDYNGWGRKRVGALREAGFIKRLTYGTFQSVYLLTEKGRNVLQHAGLRRLKTIRWTIAQSRVEHEVMVASVGLLAKEVLGLGVRLDRDRFFDSGEQTAVGRKVPVADLWVAGAAGECAMEVELSQKWWARFEEKWPTFHLINPATPLLYLTGFKFGMQFILAQSERIHAPYVYVCDLKAFRDSLGRAKFINAEGKSLCLTEG